MRKVVLILILILVSLSTGVYLYQLALVWHSPEKTVSPQGTADRSECDRLIKKVYEECMGLGGPNDQR